jgi:hypothetical protein
MSEGGGGYSTPIPAGPIAPIETQQRISTFSLPSKYNFDVAFEKLNNCKIYMCQQTYCLSTVIFHLCMLTIHTIEHMYTCRMYVHTFVVGMSAVESSLCWSSALDPSEWVWMSLDRMGGGHLSGPDRSHGLRQDYHHLHGALSTIINIFEHVAILVHTHIRTYVSGNNLNINKNH